VLWWIPAGKIPTLRQGIARLGRLRAAGPGPEAFTFRDVSAPGRVLRAVRSTGRRPSQPALSSSAGRFRSRIADRAMKPASTATSAADAP
jgi:hypothetical protein